MIKVEFTKEEAQVLVNLIDIACKAAGMQAAEACVHLTKKIQAAAEVAAASDLEIEKPA